MHTLVNVAIGLARGVLYGLLVWLCVVAYRRLSAKAPILGRILAAGIAVRVVTSVFLFVVSYYMLPFLQSMQFGGGFWALALDGEWYFFAAIDGALGGLGSIPSSAASPSFVRVLSVWLWVFGFRPLNGALLNIVTYVIAAMIVSGAAASTRAATVALLALTVSPALIIFGSQPMKDSLAVLLIVFTLAGARAWVLALREDRNRLKNLLVGWGGLAVAIYEVAGMRAYFALFTIVALGVMGTAEVFARGRRGAGARVRTIFAYGLLLTSLWAVFSVGGGPYFDHYATLVKSAFVTPLAPLQEMEAARAGFVRVGGATSIAYPDSVPPLPIHALDITGTSVVARLERMLQGCLTLFVPISLLKLLSLVSFGGGRGLLFITDFDTLVMDFTLVLALFALWKERPYRELLPLVIFVAVLEVMTICAMGYVVTNFGTMFRLRLLVAAPLWLLPAFASRHSTRPA